MVVVNPGRGYAAGMDLWITLQGQGCHLRTHYVLTTYQSPKAKKTRYFKDAKLKTT